MPLSTKKRMDQELGLRQPIEIPSSQRKTTGFTSSQSSGPSSSQPSSSQSVPPPPDINHFIAQSEQVRPRDIEEIAQQWGEPESVLEQMPMASQPDTIKATLLPYQLQVRNPFEPRILPRNYVRISNPRVASLRLGTFGKSEMGLANIVEGPTLDA